MELAVIAFARVMVGVSELGSEIEPKVVDAAASVMSMREMPAAAPEPKSSVSAVTVSPTPPAWKVNTSANTRISPGATVLLLGSVPFPSVVVTAEAVAGLPVGVVPAE